MRELTDAQLLARLESAVRNERKSSVEVLACLSEVERRKLHSELGYSSMFEFCAKKHRYSGGGAYRRVYAARAANRFPEIYALIRDGELSLCGRHWRSPI